MNDFASRFASRKAFANPLESLLGYQLRRASAAIFADLTRTIADLDLKPTDASVILLIADNPDITQSDLCRILGLQRANMAPIAAMLAERGVIERSPADGRSHALRLGTEGEELAQTLRARIAEHESRFLPDLPVEMRAELIGRLQQVWVR